MCFLIFLRRTLRSAAHSNYRSGFTLIELTIVMIIVGMLVAGMAQGLKVYYQKIALDKTVNNIAAVERALKKHVAENKAYPCPALYSAAASTPAYGQPDCISSEQIGTAPATVLVGMVPARILGLPDSAVVDGWGKKLTYGITQAMTVSGSITGDDTIDAKGVISVIDEANVERAKPPAQAPYVVISHGQDGRGAYTPAGTKAEDCNTAAIDGKNCDFSDIIFRFTENRSYTGNNNNYDDFIGFNVPMGVAPVGDICSLQSKFYVGIGALGADENGCKAPAPIMKRIVFSTPGTHTWKVPKGVHSAFVSMAGGGGSGSGWRVISTTYTGASGGFVFSHPLNLVEEEVMTIIVGKGGQGHRPYRTSTIAAPGLPYYVYDKPNNSSDDGIAGYPGTSSKVISPTNGLLLECTGGSGTGPSKLDNYTGGQVAGDLPGARYGSGNEQIPYPQIQDRRAEGPYSITSGPGACGPNDYGRGNIGAQLWNMDSGLRYGGQSPFKYGSGGDVSTSGCYINVSTTGKCISPLDAKHGIVMLDILIYE